LGAFVVAPDEVFDRGDQVSVRGHCRLRNPRDGEVEASKRRSTWPIPEFRTARLAASFRADAARSRPPLWTKGGPIRWPTCSIHRAATTLTSSRSALHSSAGSPPNALASAPCSVGT
jgi:hypothetical protein